MGASGFTHLEIKEITQETDKCFLCVITKADDIELDKWEEWIPKSQIADADNYSKGDKNASMSVTDWIAEKIGFFK